MCKSLNSDQWQMPYIGLIVDCLYCGIYWIWSWYNYHDAEVSTQKLVSYLRQV